MAVLLLAFAGLMENGSRAGPYEAAFEPMPVAGTVTGTTQFRPDTSVVGLCPAPPCGPHAAVDLRFASLPAARYEAVLLGDQDVALGALQAEGNDHVLRWEAAADHTDATHVVLRVAQRDVAVLALAPRLDGPLTLAWPAPPTGHARLTEVGGLVVSTWVDIRLERPPAAPTQAVLDGQAGRTTLGDVGPDGRLEARVERMPLEHQHRLLLLVDGFPVAGVPLPP